MAGRRAWPLCSLVLALGCTSADHVAPRLVGSRPPPARALKPARAAEPVEQTNRTRAERLVEALSAENFDLAHGLLGASLKQRLTREKLAQAWAATLAELGTFLAVTETEEKPSGELERVRFTCEFSRKRGVIEVVFDAKRHVSGL